MLLEHNFLKFRTFCSTLLSRPCGSSIFIFNRHEIYVDSKYSDCRLIYMRHFFSVSAVTYLSVTPQVFELIVSSLNLTLVKWGNQDQSSNTGKEMT